MTSHQDIQSLIADIDNILPKADVRFPWSKPGDIATQHQVLERVRSYLVAQQQSATAPQHPLSPHVAPAEIAEPLTQAVAQELEFLRTDFIQLLQSNLDELRHEREALVREIQTLERTRQPMPPLPQTHSPQQPPLSDLSPDLLNALTEVMTQQIERQFAKWEARLAHHSTTPKATPPTLNQQDLGTTAIPTVESSESLRQGQTQTDQLLLALDANQRVIFETLQRNLQAYQQSLSQGLEKMHSLSLQGEILVTALVTRLSQPLNQESPTLTPSSQPEPTTAPTPLQATSQPVLEPLPPPNALQNPESLPLSALNPQSLPRERALEQLATEDWEIVEGLELEDFDLETDDDQVDTFIQLDITPTAPLPGAPESQPSSVSEADERESFSKLADQSSASVTPSESASTIGLAAPEDTTSESRKDVDELYESLFATQDVSEIAQQEEPQALSAQPMTGQLNLTEVSEPEDSPSATTTEAAPLSSDVKAVLFEGLDDPATQQPIPTQSEAVTPLTAQSWEASLFDDAAPLSPTQADGIEEAQPALSPADPWVETNSTIEAASVETIASLTDLLVKMSLSDTFTTATDLTPTPLEGKTTGTDSTASLGEEPYTGASATGNDVARAPNREIALPSNTPEQFQHNTEDFEESEQHPQSYQEQQSTLAFGNTNGVRSSASLSPTAEPTPQQSLQFPVWEELLVEDWEEFGLHDLNEEISLATTEFDLRQPQASDQDIAKASDAPESIATDFDPDLFPEETLEFDSNLMAQQALDIEPEDVIMTSEPNALPTSSADLEAQPFNQAHLDVDLPQSPDSNLQPPDHD